MSPFARALCLLLLLGAPAAAQPVKVVAAGDISCDPADPSYNGGNGTATACRMKATSDLALALAPDAVLLLGDNQYENGSLAKYQASYDPSWGRLKAITYPIPGNHEYLTAGAAGYYTYFGAAAADPAQGWYSFDLGGWHIVALNSNCAQVGGCGPGSPQGQWLAADLAAHPGVCTLAYWHHPRFSSGPHGNDAISAPFWDALYAARADLVLVGHDHGYERFAPQTPAGAADPAKGIRQIVVGTGGKNLTGIVAVKANSEVRRYDTFGVLGLTLHPNGYEWRFEPAGGGAFTDSGVSLCHSALPSGATSFHTLPPCRLADTRSGSPLPANQRHTFPAAGLCDIPADAVAVAANVTVIQPTASGHLRLYPTGAATPDTSVLNFRTGRTRANNALVALGVEGKIDVRCELLGGASGSAHVVIDVTGYFR